jgi:hypothetical protein
MRSAQPVVSGSSERAQSLKFRSKPNPTDALLGHASGTTHGGGRAAEVSRVRLVTVWQRRAVPACTQFVTAASGTRSLRRLVEGFSRRPHTGGCLSESKICFWLSGASQPLARAESPTETNLASAVYRSARFCSRRFRRFFFQRDRLTPCTGDATVYTRPAPGTAVAAAVST